MKPKHVFISLDGVDGVGKTTVAKLLAVDDSFQCGAVRKRGTREKGSGPFSTPPHLFQNHFL